MSIINDLSVYGKMGYSLEYSFQKEVFNVKVYSSIEDRYIFSELFDDLDYGFRCALDFLATYSKTFKEDLYSDLRIGRGYTVDDLSHIFYYLGNMTITYLFGNPEGDDDTIYYSVSERVYLKLYSDGTEELIHNNINYPFITYGDDLDYLVTQELQDRFESELFNNVIVW